MVRSLADRTFQLSVRRMDEVEGRRAEEGHREVELFLHSRFVVRASLHVEHDVPKHRPGSGDGEPPPPSAPSLLVHLSEDAGVLGRGVGEQQSEEAR